MIHIPSNEIKQPLLHADTLGFTFVWQGHFLRGIFPESVSWARTYFESGFIDEIVSKRLFPKTWISDFENEQFGMIIEHEMISPVLYATDWNSTMLKDAAMMVLDIAEIGWKYGYNMVDCHKLNVMFKDNHPLYVDLGSFVPKENGSTGWKPYKGFLESYTYILDLWTNGCEHLAKRMMSPGVFLHSEDYWAWKRPIYRRIPALLSIKSRILSQTNSFAIMGSDTVNSNRGHCFLKRNIDLFKPCKSQHINWLRRDITRLSITLEQDRENGRVFDYSFISPEKSVTCINICNTSILKGLQGKFSQIISLNESDSSSNFEYQRLKGITSVCFPLLNGGILIRDKFPETRLVSDVVLVKCAIKDRGQFALHNSIVFLERCLSYSRTGKMFIWMPSSNSAMVDLINEVFIIKNISENKSLILVQKRNK